jgi:rubrerythrin
VDKSEKYGWCITKLSEEALTYVHSLDEQSFKLHRSRIPKIKTSSSSSSRKYVCPICGTIIRATKEVNVRCGDCGVEFEEEI